MGRYLRGMAAIAALVLGASSLAHSAENAGLQSGLSLSGFYSGPVSNIGTFRGKLLCLCCDLGQSAEAAKKCDANGHHNALSVNDDAMIHPLIAGTEEATKELNSDALHGKEVLVTGKYYPSTGFIFVQTVRPAN